MNTPKVIGLFCLITVTGAALAGTPYRGLPTGYLQVESIKSAGDQFINTGLRGSTNLTTVLDYIPHKGGGTSSFGFSYNDNADWRFFTSGSSFYYDVGNQRASSATYVMNRRVRIELGKGPKGGPKLTVYDTDGNKLGESTSQNGVTTIEQLDLGLFGGYQNLAQTTIHKDTMTLYSMVVRDCGEIVRDFVPCKCLIAGDPDEGQYGLYDVQNGNFYSNVVRSASKDFVAGPAVPIGVTPSLAFDAVSGYWKVTLTVTGGAGKLYLNATDGNGVTTEYFIADVTGPNVYEKTLDELVSSAAYTIGYKTVYTGEGAQDTDFQTYTIANIFTGGVTLEKAQDADEADGTRGIFRASLTGGATAVGAMTVYYTVESSSTAVADQTYVALSGTATIPSGSNGVDILVTPKIDKTVTEDKTVVVKLAEGTYAVATPDPVSLTVKNSSTFAWWFYDPAAGTITDGTWQFAAAPMSVTDQTHIYVSDVNNDPAKGPVPTEVSPLSLANPVVSSTGAEIGIHTVGYCFYRGATPAEAGQYLGALTLPEGLKKIDINAFRFLYHKWTSTVVIPSTVEYIGESAFQAALDITIDASTFPQGVTFIGPNAFNAVSGFTGDLTLPALVTDDLRATFDSTGLASVRFGPSVTGLSGGYAQGPIQSCKSLTNVVFDAQSVVLRPGFVFRNCSALKELDLSMVTKFSDEDDRGGYFNNSGLERVVFSDKLKYLSSKTFEAASKLREVVFMGPPPDNFKLPYLWGASQCVTTIVYKANYRMTNALGKCWLDYAEGGAIGRRGTTMKSSCISVDPSLRPLIAPDVVRGLLVIVR